MKIELTDFDSDLWEYYKGAYGTVKEEVRTLMGIPEDATDLGIINRWFDESNLESEHRNYEIAYDNLCESLWHQMSFYNAMYLVLPYITELLTRWESQGDYRWQYRIIRDMGLCLANDIPAVNSSSTDNAIMQNYQASIFLLQEKSKAFLIRHFDQLKREKDIQMFLTALLAILDDRQAAYILILSYWDTCYMLCTNCEYCEEELELSDFEARKAIVPAESVIGKWDKRSLDDTYMWLSNLAYLLGDTLSAEALRYFYGTYTCPECGKQEKVWTLIKNYYFD